MADRMKNRLCAALRAQLAGEPAHPPEGTAPFWNAFMALSRARTCGPVGPNPIAYSEILAWSHLTRMPLDPHHVEIITALDEVWIERAYQGRGEQHEGHTLPRSSGHALTPALFDLATG